MSRRVRSVRVPVPAFASRLWFQAVALAVLGALWLVAFRAVWLTPKALGGASFGWWVIYLGLPVPLAVWGWRFAFRFGRKLTKMKPADSLLFLIGLLGACPPVFLVLLFAFGS